MSQQSGIQPNQVRMHSRWGTHDWTTHIDFVADPSGSRQYCPVTSPKLPPTTQRQSHQFVTTIFDSTTLTLALRLLYSKAMPGVEAKAVLNEQDKQKMRATVYFAVLSAKDLPSASTHCCAAPLAVNASATFMFRGVEGTTAVEKQTCSPVWNMEMVSLGSANLDSREEVVITIHHHNRMSKNRVLCQATIPISRMLAAGKGNHQRWLRLTSKGRKMDKEHPPHLLVKYNNE